MMMVKEVESKVETNIFSAKVMTIKIQKKCGSSNSPLYTDQDKTYIIVKRLN